MALDKLKIRFKSTHVKCPACGRMVHAGLQFWSHYNAAHAVRPHWLNPADWHHMIDKPYQLPPEQIRWRKERYGKGREENRLLEQEEKRAQREDLINQKLLAIKTQKGKANDD